MNTRIEDKLKELEAIIRLYKDDAFDGLRNKVWTWHSQEVQRERIEAVKDFVNSTVAEIERAKSLDRRYILLEPLIVFFKEFEKEYIESLTKEEK